MKRIIYTKKNKLLLFLFTLFATGTFAQAPGGIASTSSTQGLRYELYTGNVTLANLRAGTYGTLRQTGYTNSMWSFNGNVSQKGTYTLVGKGNITVTGATYFFEMPSVDDNGVIIVNGTEVFAKQVSFAAAVNISINLPAGTYPIEIRYSSDNVAASLPVTWRSSPASDAPTSATQIPDSKFSISSVLMGGWYKADAGVSGSDGTFATAWADQSANTNKTNLVSSSNATGAPTGTSPIYRSSTLLMNFNPVVEFTNSGRMVSNINGNNLGYGNKSQTLIAVSSTANTGEVGYIVTFGNDVGNGQSSLSQLSNTTMRSAVTGSGILSPAGVFSSTYVPVIGENSFDGTLASADHKLFVNGGTTAAATATYTADKQINDNPDFSIGGLTDGNTGAEWYDGTIAEVITYPWALTATERNKVHSYLAVKYGVTLGSTTDAVNYTNSAGTTMWAGDAVFQNNIAGIARDDNSTLNQKQSQSQNPGQSLVLSNGTGGFAASNTSNTNTFAADLQSLIWGDNNLSTDISVNISGSDYRMSKIWKVQDVGAVGTVTIAYPAAAFGTVFNPTLIYSNTASLAGYAFAPNVGTATVNGVLCYLFQYNFNDNGATYFSFAGTGVAPGGVLAPAAPVNGIKYELYNGVVANRAALVAGTYGTLKQVGYVNTFYTAITNAVAGEIGTSYTVVGKASFTIANPGDYQFQMSSIDDFGAIFIDGVLAFSDEIGGAAATITTQTLAAGSHTIEIRFSQGAGAAICQPEWKGNTTGLDAGTSFVQIPDSKFFMSPIIGTWHKADLGVTGSDGTSASAWADQSLNTNKTDLTILGGPVYRTTTNQHNFNPSIDFGGSGAEQSADDANNLPYSKQGTTSFAVGSRATLATGTNDFLLSYGTDNVASAMGLIYQSSNKIRTGTNSYPATTVQSAADVFTTIGRPDIAVQDYQNYNLVATLNNQQFVDGASSATAITDAGTNREINDNRDFRIGADIDGTSGWNGYISEAITYPWPLNATERLRVNSYLAIKYGITLANGTSSYVFSDASGTNDMWTPANNAGYIHDIAGISRDDASALYQKQSRSVNDNAFVTLGIGTIAVNNAANTNTIDADKSSLVWSANLATAPVLALAPAYSISIQGFNTLLDKRWKVQLSGTGLAGKTIRVAIPTTNGVISAANNFLIVSTTGAFNAANETYYPLSTSGSYLYADVPTTVLSNATYFTFGSKVIAPGGVITSLAFWSKSDDAGTITTAWKDNSPAKNAIENVGGLTLSTADANHNYEPFITGFSATKYFNDPATSIPSSYSSYGIFTAVRATSIAQGGITGMDVTAANAATPRAALNTSGNCTLVAFGSTANSTSGSITANKSSVLSFVGDQDGNAGAGADYLSMDGITNIINRTTTYSTNGPNLTVGRAAYATAPFGTTDGPFPGDIMEVIWYKQAPSLLTDTRKISTYLSIKHGTTLGNNVSTINYIDTKNNTIFSSAGVYQNNIGGIGRDDNEALNHKQSRSVNPVPANGQVTIGLGTIAVTNAANTNTFTKDNSYLVWGDNGQTTTLQADIAATAPTFTYNGYTTNERMNRVWKGMATNFAQAVKVSINAVGIIGIVSTTGCQKLCLITATDAGFTSGVTATNLVLNGANYEANIVFPSGTFYYTFGRVVQKPGGTAYLPVVATTSVPLYSLCLENGWQYYYSDATGGSSGPATVEGTRKIFALYANGNTIPSTLTGNVTYQAGPYTQTAGLSQVNIMGRLLTITDPTAGSYTANGGMKVRVYYSDAELTASLVPGPTINQAWFKFEGDAASTVAANNGSTITGATFFSGLTNGTEDSVSYVEYTGITNFSTFGFSSNNGLTNPLPVLLTDFTVKLLECNAELNWKSAAESRSSSYEVEFSKDGINFDKIVTVAGKGDNSSYNYTYHTPAGRSYYRIKLLSSDISVPKYSQTVIVNSNCNNSNIVIFPNPVSTVIHLNLSNYTGKVTGQLHNSKGQLLQNISLINGMNSIACQNLASGIYILRVTNSIGETEVYKIQVMH